MQASETIYSQDVHWIGGGREHDRRLASPVSVRYRASSNRTHSDALDDDVSLPLASANRSPPVLFNSYVFIFLFIPITLLLTRVGFRVAGSRGSTAVVLLASLYFYSFHDRRLLALIVLSIIGNYAITGVIGQQSGAPRTYLTALGVCANLALLGYFKYTNFFLENISTLVGGEVGVRDIALPIGISFYTFQQVAYNVDTFKGKVEQRDFLSYALFVTFFPQLIAGPIVHHGQIIRQFVSRRFGAICWDDVLVGFSIFGAGLFAKKIIADSFGTHATPLFFNADEGLTLTFVEAWTASITYTFQIYFDFSGYSVMAIGLGRLFGIKLPVNFLSPYKSASIIDFWRRWHITLSTFLRDYIYIALGGNRKGSARRWGNLLTTMLIGGLWHGASWNFVIWGALHGAYLVINHAWRSAATSIPVLGAVRASAAFRPIAWAITFLSVVVAWVGFRATTMRGNVSILSSMFGLNGFGDIALEVGEFEPTFFALLVAGIVLAIGAPNMASLFGDVRATYEEVDPMRLFGVRIAYRPTAIWTIVMAVIAAVAVFYQAPTTEFLYWDF